MKESEGFASGSFWFFGGIFKKAFTFLTKNAILFLRNREAKKP